MNYGNQKILIIIIYNDLSSSTYKNVNRIIDYFNIDNVITFNNDAINFCPDYEFDSMFTCPPYFNLEKYECDEFIDLDEYNKFIDSLFDIFYKKDSCKIFGLVIREDLLSDKLKDKCERCYDLKIKKSVHLNSSKNNLEYLYIFTK